MYMFSNRTSKKSMDNIFIIVNVGVKLEECNTCDANKKLASSRELDSLSFKLNSSSIWYNSVDELPL